MKPLKAIIVSILLVLSLASCSQRTKWHQKVTVVFATPDGPVTATNVMRVAYKSTWVSHNLGGGQFWTLEGEALMARLGEEYVFLTLHSMARDIFVDSYNAKYSDGGRYSNTVKKIKTHWDPLEVPNRYWPVFVVFDEVSDPDSWHDLPAKEFSARFGAGYAVERITVQATREKITTGAIRSVLSFSEAALKVGSFAR